MTQLPHDLRVLIQRGPLAHLATINADGGPQATVIWIGLDGDDVVSGHMTLSQKIRNVQREPRVVLSFDGPRRPGEFLAQHAVLPATASVEKGGAWRLLDRLGKVYVEPEFTFPGDEDRGGYVLRYSILRIGGVGPWASPAH